MAFEPDPFTPGWWCRGPHAQTIWASVLRQGEQRTAVRRERLETPDGDFFDVDVAPAAPSAPALIILHGLEGSSTSAPVRRLLSAASARGWEGLAVNFRSCSGEINRLRTSYHAGDTQDLAWLIERVARAPGRRIVCVGFSLGGNVLLKYLGEAPHRVPPAVTAAVAISTPFDLGAGARAFRQPGFNQLYQRRLMRSLKRKTLQKLAAYPDLVDRAALNAIHTIDEFDELVTAPINGFAGAEAYWQASSCTPHLGAIRVPSLLINADDDPVVPAAALPRALAAQHPYVTAAFTAGGGHVGFVSGRSPSKPVFWAQERALAFCARHLS